jgi:predicted MFS family arabinose efflux permease
MPDVDAHQFAAAAAARSTTTIRAEISAGLRFIARDPYLRPLTIYPAVSNFAYSGSTALVVVFLIRTAGFSAAAAGLLIGAGGIGGVLGAVAARRLARWLGTARALLISALGTGLFGLLIPLTTTGPRAICFPIGSAIVAGAAPSASLERVPGSAPHTVRG